MADFLKSFLLGAVEGATEFIPIDSTAHLRLLDAWLHIDPAAAFWKIQSIAIHLGAMFAVLIFYARQLHRFTRTALREQSRTILAHRPSFAGWAFVVSAVSAFFLKKVIHQKLASLSMAGAALLLGGVLLWLVDLYRTSRQTRKPTHVTLAQATWVGLCQTISTVFPEASRTMVTIVAGEIGGLPRTTAVEFSFMLFVPTVLAATFREMLDESRSGSNALSINAHGLAVVFAGFCIASAVGYLSLSWMLNWVRRHGLGLFGLYRICLGLAVLISAARL